MTAEGTTTAPAAFDGTIFEGFEVISRYTREQAIEDGVLADVTEWASAEKGFHGGFTCPVAMTRELWNAVEAIPKSLKGIADVRGRAHDVLWMASLPLRHRPDALFKVILPHRGTRKRTQVLRAVVDGDGVTIGFPGDF